MKTTVRITPRECIAALNAPDTSAQIISWDKSGALAHLFPEITVMKRSAKKFYFHPNGLWQHALETLESLEQIAGALAKIFPQDHAALTAHLAGPHDSALPPLSILKLTALFHDAAKPQCAKRTGAKTRFIGHEDQGARLMASICKRLKLPPATVARARLLVAQHMRPISLTQADELTPRATRRFFTALGDAAPDLLLLALADWHSYKRLKTHDRRLLKKQEAVVREMMHRFFAAEAPPPTRIIDGAVIMKQFKLESGPLIGALLALVAKAQERGAVTTKEAAFALIRSKLTLYQKRYRMKRHFRRANVRA